MSAMRQRLGALLAANEGWFWYRGDAEPDGLVRVYLGNSRSPSVIYGAGHDEDFALARAVEQAEAFLSPETPEEL